ncbi:MAG TPA: tyrosine-type recombinase/integrase [Candidatus Acidoferrales bacterium]|nr:tyrosine-type recombinase/integrase [Candidatus Acidoferrales bacterium]
MNTVPASSNFGFVSPLAPQLARFLALKHAMGYRYTNEGCALRRLDYFLNSRMSADDSVITSAIVHEYVARRGTESETTRAHRLTLIREVCRFLRLEDPRVVVPDRRYLPIVRRKFVPRVLSRDEGRRFLQACAELSSRRTSPIRTVVLGTALRVLYLVGLRAGELLRLTHADVDFDAGILHIRHTKFDKSRIVPLAPDLVTRLVYCRTVALEHFGSCLPQMPVFPNPRGRRYSLSALHDAFLHVLRTAGIERTSNSRIRLHDLRHSFACLRLLLWCEQNVDFGAKLPLLATYLGHIDLSSSQRYLQLTPDLMGEITRRHQARFGYLIQEGSR